MTDAYPCIGRRLFATATSAIVQNTSFLKKSLLVDGNNVIYHFYNQMSNIETCKMAKAKMKRSMALAANGQGALS
ncbi:hypothetical protein Plhal304r1_c113g0176621 [Plasmopara halstedii]